MKLLSFVFLMLLADFSYAMRPEAKEPITFMAAIRRRISGKTNHSGQLRLYKKKSVPQPKKEEEPENSLEDMRMLMKPDEYNFRYLISQVDI